MKGSDNRDFVNSVRQKYSPTMPNIDRDRYTDIPGMEGPFMLRSGKVVYYDPKEGKYYDRDSDMYMSDEDYHAHSSPRTESVNFHRFWEILEAGTPWNQRPENSADFKYHYGGEPGEDYEPHMVHGAEELQRKLNFSNGSFVDVEAETKLPTISLPEVQNVIGEPDDTYTLSTRIVVSGELTDDGIDHENVQYEVDGFDIVNDRTGKRMQVPDNLVREKIVGMSGSQTTYQINYDLDGGKIKVAVEPA